MGNSHRITHDNETSSEMVKNKDDIHFDQGDFIREIEGNIQHQYEILSPPLRKNQFYELRKIIHFRTKLVKSAFIINKYKVHTEQRKLLEHQIAKLKKIDNPFLLKIYELYKDSHRFYIVCEFCEGYSLSRILEDEGPISQKKSAIVMRQLLYLLNDCHQQGIIHSDLKLQNIAFNSRKQNVIKVSDFSISRIFRVQDIIDQSYRKAFLAAPQTLNGDSCFESDIWSCGIILYILWTGQLPFYGSSSIKKMKHKLIHFQLNVSHEKFQMISKEGKKLIKLMLNYDKAERPSAIELLNHPWFKKFYKPSKITEMTLMRTLIECYNFNPSSKLQEATWNFYVTVAVSFEEKQSILQIFQSLDTEFKGELGEQDLYRGFLKITCEKKARFFANFIFQRHKRGIKFSEFVSLSTNRSFLIDEINSKKVFDIFDDDKSGQISVSELRAALGASKQISEDIWLQLMKEADENADGEISFEQFDNLMNDLKNITNQKLIRESSGKHMLP